ncbi:hypothetical protein ElyMa_003686200 [Elysia marginata]|uniref:Uncharacterized protein n=1 Tax=Elysia marginata TaxID=1093978 RepID=A0AAV4F1G7_9GAST|nr:hypothetical protein ElyMa_003686200 [Elysia marginata]
MAGGDVPVGALRVSQLDASELDQEVVGITKSQISQLFKYHGNHLVKGISDQKEKRKFLVVFIIITNGPSFRIEDAGDAIVLVSDLTPCYTCTFVLNMARSITTKPNT